MTSLRSRASALAFACSLGSLALASHASAQETSAENKAAARELAIEGTQLASAGNCKDALPKLERAEALYHAPTILTSIGECQIKEGRLVEGTENLNRVVREQLPPSAPTLFVDAQKKAAVLVNEATPRIGRLTLEIEPAQLNGLVITIDGKPFGNALVGAPRPTDPGTHELVANAPGYKEARGSITIAEAGREQLKLVLVVDEAAQPEEPVVAQPEENQAESGGGGHTQRILGWVGIGVGGLVLAGGGATGLMALGAKNSLPDLCPGNVCSSDEAQSKYDEAQTFATTSTVLFVAGGALALTGAVLLFTAGNSSGTVEAKLPGATIRPLLGLGQAGVSGTF